MAQQDSETEKRGKENENRSEIERVKGRSDRRVRFPHSDSVCRYFKLSQDLTLSRLVLPCCPKTLILATSRTNFLNCWAPWPPDYISLVSFEKNLPLYHSNQHCFGTSHNSLTHSGHSSMLEWNWRSKWWSGGWSRKPRLAMLCRWSCLVFFWSRKKKWDV